MIAWVTTLSRQSGVSSDLVFANRKRVPFDWPDNPPDSLDDTPVGAYPHIPAEIPGVLVNQNPPGVSPISPTDEDVATHTNDHDWTALADAAMENADLDAATHLPQPPEVIEIDNDDDNANPPPLPTALRQTLQYIPKVEQDAATLFPPSSTPFPPSQLPRQPPSCYPTCVCAPPKHLDSYHLFTTVAEESSCDHSYPYTNANGNLVDLSIKNEILMAHVCHYVMTYTADKLFLHSQPEKKQYGLKAGLRMFGDKGWDAIRKELTQFHTLQCFAPKDAKTLTRNERCNALTSLIFLTKKRTGKIKACACANSSTQREHIAKDEATAPTVTTEAIFIQNTIFAHEQCNVATCNIPGAFLQADNPDYVLMRLDSILPK